MRRCQALLLPLAGALFIAGCEKKDPPPMERPPAPVVVAIAAAEDVPLYLDEIGRCVARERVSIQPQVSGRITQIHFTDGADLKAGDLLFTIDPRPSQAQLAAAEATLAQSKAVLELATLEFNRSRTLLEKKALSQQEFDTARSAVTVAEARIQLSKAAIDTVKIDLDYCAIRSPIDGRAGQRLVDMGNVIAANGGALLVIQKMDPIYAEFTVAENDLPAVLKNMAAGTLKVEVQLPDDPAASRTGDLTFLDNAVADGTGTVRLRATLANADHRFWPGQFIRARLVLAALKAAVLIPVEATQMSPAGPFVYVVQGTEPPELRPVTLGQRQGERVVVLKNLAAGERIVTKGHLGIMPGRKVKEETSAQPVAESAKP
jgi:multidrug efflux system membrane fusion protein